MKRHILYIIAATLAQAVFAADDTTLGIATEVLEEQFGKNVVEVVVDSLLPIENEGYMVERRDGGWRLSAATDAGALYGAFDMARRSRQDMPQRWSGSPAVKLRLLNHWDNLNRTVERGYAGKSIWKWDGPLTDSDKELYRRYARYNASVGINGVVINNVNASPRILSAGKLGRVREIADILRPYGIKVYLSVNFASPIALDSLPSADPLLPEVQQWWQNKADEIYDAIPDFGGFLVKANSEGQPGPMDYGRTHADGANMLAGALKPHGGIVMWRAFVYGRFY